MNINGFELPAALAANLRTGNYKLSSHQATRLRALISGIESPSPLFYGHDAIVAENRLWKSKDSHFYLGTPSLEHPPGNADPTLTLIIGDFEPDSPIALDYRTKEARVIYFCDINQVSYWVELSPSYGALMRAIGANG